MSSKHILHLFAELLSYPSSNYQVHAMELRQALGKTNEELSSFLEFVRATDIDRIEEVFTSTFDMNKTTCLEIGWHLYGEDYKRGEFLVKMRNALREHDIPESVELPDHISHCLRLLAALEAEDARIYTARFLAPALGIIRKNFKAENPFRPLVEALGKYLKTELFSETKDNALITTVR